MDTEPGILTGRGLLVLIVGPSGAGKDSLLAGAREALAGDDRFIFARRYITRPANDTTENHTPVCDAAFDAALEADQYALHWQAHGLRYAISRSIDTLLSSGHIVIANVSRTVITDCRTRYPSVRVIFIDCAQDIRSVRLRARGRERNAEITGRLTREEPSVELLCGDFRIDNSGKLDCGIATLVAALQEIAGGTALSDLNSRRPVEPA